MSCLAYPENPVTTVEIDIGLNECFQAVPIHPGLALSLWRSRGYSTGPRVFV